LPLRPCELARLDLGRQIPLAPGCPQHPLRRNHLHHPTHHRPGQRAHISAVRKVPRPLRGWGIDRRVTASSLLTRSPARKNGIENELRPLFQPLLVLARSRSRKQKNRRVGGPNLPNLSQYAIAAAVVDSLINKPSLRPICIMKEYRETIGGDFTCKIHPAMVQ